MKYFGTDGIRGVFGSGLTEELAYRVGAALGKFFGGGCVLGRDTRLSGGAIEEAVASGIAAAGCDVFLAGVLPTPAVAMLAKAMPVSFGVMISASHNPPEYNGIKVFDGNGCKLELRQEQAVEQLIHNGFSCGLSEGFSNGFSDGLSVDCSNEFSGGSRRLSHEFSGRFPSDCAGGFVRGKTEHFLGARDMYVDFLLRQSRSFSAPVRQQHSNLTEKSVKYKNNDKFYDGLRTDGQKWADGLPVWLDCGCGAACGIAGEVFQRLGARVSAINDTPDGSRINVGCGALFVDRLRDSMRDSMRGQGKYCDSGRNDNVGNGLGGSFSNDGMPNDLGSGLSNCNLSNIGISDDDSQDCSGGGLPAGLDGGLSNDGLSGIRDSVSKELSDNQRKNFGGALGFAFDGDADRMTMVWNSEVLDGDSVLYSLSRIHRPNSKVVVGTVMSNLALERQLEQEGKRLIRADVGDKNILRVMRRGGFCLGGEQSGHYIFRPQSTTGDGILAAIKMTRASILGRVARLDLVPQKTVSLTCSAKVMQDERLQRLMRECENLPARVLVRPSGTEPKIRVMAEGNTADVDEVLDKFVRLIGEIGENT